MWEQTPLKLFFYKEGEHFSIPQEVRDQFGTPRSIPLLAVCDGNRNGQEEGPVSVATPDEADYIVFPYILDQFIMAQRAMAVHFFIRDLPYFHRFERKHVFFHCHDRGHPLFTEALILTDDPDRFNTDDPFLATLPHYPGGHVLQHAPDFDFDAIDLDTNFVGTLSWPVRGTLVQSIAQEKSLRFLTQHPNTLDWSCKETSYLHMDDQAKKRELERVFLDALRRSWTTLCPRGMGSSSIRFYEVMCFGRIPVHVSDAYRLPFEDKIDYSEFCLFIPEGEAHRAGPLLRMWLARRGKNQLMAMCRKARQVWEEYFHPKDEKNVCLEYLRRHLPETKLRGGPRYGFAPSPLTGDTTPRLVTPQGFYANMAVDHRKLWLNTALMVTTSRQEPGVAFVNGVRSTIEMKNLLHLLDLTQCVPENGTVVCSGAPSGMLAIMIANGLIKARNFSSLIYCVEDWARSPSPTPGESLPDFEGNTRLSRVSDFVRPLQGGDGPAAFRDACLDMVVLAVEPAPGLHKAIAAWSQKLVRGGSLVIACRDARAVDGLMPLISRQFEHELRVSRSQDIIVLRKPATLGEEGPEDTAKTDSAGSISAHGGRNHPGRSASRVLSGGASLEDGRFLAVKATGGMGNRLLGLMCAVVYGLMTGRRLHVNWSDFMYSDKGENVFPRLFRLHGVPQAYRLPQTGDVCPEFWRPLLHTDALIEQIGINHTDPAVMDLTRVDLAKRYDQAVAAFWSYDLAPMQAALEHIRERLPRFAGLDADGICGEIMKRHIRPRPIVSERVDAFAARHFTGPVVGVHVRQTDLRMPLDETVRKVGELRDSMGAKVFLATDNQQVERSMAKLFGDDLIFMPKRYPEAGKHMHSHRIAGLTNFEKALEALTEMYLLARCDAIVRYKASSFAQISWYCSDIPAERMVCVQ